VADLAEGSPLAFAPLSGAQETALGAVLGPLVTLANPLDYHTFIWGDSEKTTAVFSEALAPYDAGLFVIDPPRSDRCDPASFEPAIEAIQQKPSRGPAPLRRPAGNRGPWRRCAAQPC